MLILHVGGNQTYRTMPVKSKKLLIQFGSGKPGEMGTGKTELEAFVGLKNPKIGFAPFIIFFTIKSTIGVYFDLVQPITKR